MKSTIIRVLSVMILASSMTAFALPEKVKNSPCCCCTAETTCAATAAAPAKGQSDHDQDKSREIKIRDQEKEWLHEIQNIPAG